MLERASGKTESSKLPVLKRSRYSLNFTSPARRSLSASDEKLMRVGCAGEIWIASRPHNTAAASDVLDNVSYCASPHVGQSARRVPVPILLHSFRQTSNCINEPCSCSKCPVSSLNASATCTAETTLMIGMMTPAVSHVGALAAGGASSNTQRKQAV